MPSEASVGASAPERDLLAEGRREDGDAHVDGAIAGTQRHAPVLRDALLRDVELCHHFQAARDRRLEILRDGGELAHDSVDTGADEQSLCLRREVDVRRAQLESAAEQLVDALDRRRARRRVAQVDDRGERVLFDLDLLVETLLAGVDSADRVRDRLRRGDADADVDAQGEPEVVRGDDVRGVVDRDEHSAIRKETHRDRAVAAGERLGEQAGGAEVDPLAGEVDERELVLLGEDAGDLRRRDVSPVDEDLAEPLAGGVLLTESLLELLDGEGAVAQKKRSERGPGMCCCFHSRR